MSNSELLYLAQYSFKVVLSMAVYNVMFYFLCRGAFLRSHLDPVLRKFGSQLLIKFILLFDALDLMAQVYLFFNGGVE